MAKPAYRTKEDEISFNIITPQVVKRLQKDGDIKLPQKKVSVSKDKRWNTKQMSSKLLQGILSGDSIPKIAQSLTDVIGNNMKAATRSARTMVTGAENVGRLDSYKELDEQGVIQKKVWIATPDERTRESHLEIDGEEVDIDEPFSNGLMYPADPDGEPEEVYNCRCSMRTHIVGIRSADGEITDIDVERDDTMHAQQIEEERESRVAEGFDIDIEKPEKEEKEAVECKKLKMLMRDEEYEEYMRLVNDSDNDELYREYADSVGTLVESKNGGAFNAGKNKLEYSIENKEGMSKYSTVAHEYSHLFDNRIGKSDAFSFGEIDLINQKCSFGSGTFKIIKETPSQSDEFLSALRKDMQALKDKGLAECYAEFKATTAFKNSTAGIQDALDGFFGTQKNYGAWGHGDRYYNRKYNDWIKGFGKEKDLKDALKSLGMDASNQTKVKQIFRQYEASSEAWANVGSAITCKGSELDAFEKYMPNTVATYKEMIGRLKNA